MDNKLVLTVLFVTLSWLSVRTCVNCTTATATTPTATTPTATTPTATTPIATTPIATTPIATTPITTTPIATTPIATTPIATTPIATTLATTTAGPLIPNTSVSPLADPITNVGCSTEKLCASEPPSCNPAVTDPCNFISIRHLSGQNFAFEIAGQTEGFLSITLSTDTIVGNGDDSLACARDGTAALFFSTRLTDGTLIEIELPVTNVKARVVGNKIECTFDFTVPEPEARAGVVLALASGSYDPETGLGAPEILIESPPVDLTDPGVVIENQATTTTTTTTTPSTSTATTTSHAITLQQSLMQALLISVGVLSLAMLL